MLMNNIGCDVCDFSRTFDAGDMVGKHMLEQIHLNAEKNIKSKGSHGAQMTMQASNSKKNKASFLC